jgi:peptidyl-prolyl cis-trans isomerase SurA
MTRVAVLGNRLLCRRGFRFMNCLPACILQALCFKGVLPGLLQSTIIYATIFLHETTHFVYLIAVSAGLFAQVSCHRSTQAGNQVSAPASKPKLVNSIAVVVNDEVITQSGTERTDQCAGKRLKAQGTQAPNRAELKKQLIERMILDRAQIQLAKENGMRVDDLTLDRTLVKMAEQNKMNLQEMRNQIEREGTPCAKFREEIRDDIMMQRIRDREVDSKILITESEVDNYLAQKRW